jgi:hypothetical protein
MPEALGAIATYHGMTERAHHRGVFAAGDDYWVTRIATSVRCGWGPTVDISSMT